MIKDFYEPRRRRIESKSGVFLGGFGNMVAWKFKGRKDKD